MIGQILVAFAKLQKVIISFLMLVRLSVSFDLSVYPSVRPSAWNNSPPTGPIFINFLFQYFSKIYRENSNAIKSTERKTNTLHEYQHTFAIFPSVLLRIKNVSDQSFRENQNTLSTFSNALFENHIVSEKNAE